MFSCFCYFFNVYFYCVAAGESVTAGGVTGAGADVLVSAGLTVAGGVTGVIDASEAGGVTTGDVDEDVFVVLLAVGVTAESVVVAALVAVVVAACC